MEQKKYDWGPVEDLPDTKYVWDLEPDDFDLRNFWDATDLFQEDEE